MDTLSDPDSDLIFNICKKLIGATISFGYKIECLDGNVETNDITNCNIIGDCLEDIIFPMINKEITTFQRGPSQKSPDFWNRNKVFSWELKAFCGSPSFDISNYTSFINQLSENNGVLNKIFKTQYLIFKYRYTVGKIIIEDFKSCKVNELMLYTGKYPISLQNKRKMWYNIRPCSFKDISKNKTPDLFIEKIIQSIELCPNHIEKKETIINSIRFQFNKLTQTNSQEQEE